MLLPTRSINHWPDNRCAKAFWAQHKLPPYQQLLADTAARLHPKPGDRWLDLGCGRGMLSRAVWETSQGRVDEVIGLDIAPANADAYEKLQCSLQPVPEPGQVRFIAADFSAGLRQFRDNSFDGVVSGLALTYAESYCEERQCWTSDAYDHVLAEVRRVLKPSGRFVFSVNVPEPAWGKVAWDALRGAFDAARPHRYLLKAWRIYRYGGWLKREARRGRFHYLPLETIRAKLLALGFGQVDGSLSFSGQAYVISCRAGMTMRLAA
jgi:SAM-dependent methyltransferase